MTTYRFWPSTNGPASVTSFSGGFTGATSFGVYGGGNWFNGYYLWVPTGGDTAPAGGFNCALWSITGSTGPTGTLISGASISGYSTTLTANSWNFIPLANPIQLAPSWDKNSTANGTAYLACVGWTASAGFPDTNGYWGAGAGTNGITNGPLIAYSSNSGTSNKAPWGLAQGLFSTNSNPISTMPTSVSGTDNFWVDVQISDTAPAGYSGSYRLWPNLASTNPTVVGDAAVNYTVATEISLSQACTLNNVWYFSPAASTTLATRCDVWNVGTGLSVASITSPSWKTAAGGTASAGTGPGGQWIQAAFAGGTVIPAGTYRVSVYNSAGSTDANWGPKDASTDYWGQTSTTSAGAQGITWGPLSAPKFSAASSGYVFGGAGTDTPPWSSGGTAAAHAQPVFYQPSANNGAVGFPQLYAVVNVNQTQNYWVDLEATPVPSFWTPPRAVRIDQPHPGPWTQRDRRDANTTGSAANPLVSPLDSAWQADALYSHLYADSHLRDRRAYFYQRPLVSDPSLLGGAPADPLALNPEQSPSSDMWRVAAVPAFYDRREVPQQRAYVSDPLLLATALLENELLGGAQTWLHYVTSAYIDRREVPQQRLYVSDPSAYPPQSNLDPLLAGQDYLELHQHQAATHYDRREVPQQRLYISDPSFYPAVAPTDPLTVAWGAGGPYWHLYNRAADAADRRAYFYQRLYVSDPLLLTTALLENELLGSADDLARHRAWYADRRQVPQQRAYFSAVDVPFDVTTGAWADLLRRWVTAATHYDRRLFPQQRLYFPLPAPPPPFTIGVLTAVTAAGGAGGTLTATDTRTGGPA